MIKSIEIINYLDESLKIELGAPETSGLWVKSIKGIGPGKASISTTDMASSDGGIFNSARSEIRNITLSLGVVERRDSDNKIVSVETTRRKLYKFFGKKREICFYINTDYKFDPSNEEDTGSSFYIVGYVESCEPDIFNKQETIAISIVCPNPNFYKVGGYDNISFSGTDSLFQFPMDYDETTDDDFDGENHDLFYPGRFYYEYDSETEQYFITLDEKREVGKTYYKGGLSNDTSSEETEYIETTDTSFIPGKEYFREDPNNPGQMMSAPELTKISGYTYYEYNNKIKFADILNIIEQDLYYYGEIEVGVTINLRFGDSTTGVKILKILNENESEELTLDDSLIEGGGISPNDEIIINTVRGQKYAYLIRDTRKYNILNALGKNPAWFQLNYGRNTFSYSADTGEEFMDMTISYDEAYEGV